MYLTKEKIEGLSLMLRILQYIESGCEGRGHGAKREGWLTWGSVEMSVRAAGEIATSSAGGWSFSCLCHSEGG